VKCSFLYLIPDLMEASSGIARYARMVCKALLDSGHELAVVALVDKGRQGSSLVPAFTDMAYWPCHGSRAGFVRRAIAITLRRRPAIILVGHPNFVPLGWLLGRLSGARLITFIYGIDAVWPLSAPHRWTLQRSDRILSISRFTAEQAAKVNGIPPERVRILHNCLDPAFEAPLALDEDPGSLSMLTVGRMSLAEQYKGQDYVIRAMPALLERFPQLEYHVVGDGDWRPVLETLAAQVGVKSSVCFHGFVPEEELRSRYAQASLFVMPSRAEGFGFVYLEAMAHGLPVIGGNVDATPEVVLDGQTGYLVNPVSVDSIVAAATRLLGDGALRQRMGQAGVQHVWEKFRFGRFRQTLLNHLSEVVPIADPDRCGTRHAGSSGNG